MSVETSPGNPRQRIEEAVSAWMTSQPAIATPGEKQSPVTQKQEKDKEKEKQVLAAVSAWSGGSSKDIRKKAAKDKKEAKKKEKEAKKKQGKDKEKDKDKDKDKQSKKSGLFGRGKQESTSTLPISQSNPQISALAQEEPTSEENPPPLRFAVIQQLLLRLRALHGEEMEGIFRISGNTNVVKSIWRTFVQDTLPELDEFGTSAHDYAGALKLYLREAPEPVIPADYTPKFLDALKSTDPLLRVFGVAEAINELPRENRLMIREICYFLKEINENSDRTKMDLKNITIAFGPSFFPGAKSSVFDYKTIGQFCEVVNILVTNLEDIFVDMDCDTMEEARPNGRSGSRSNGSHSPTTSTRSVDSPPVAHLQIPHDEGSTSSSSSSPNPASAREISAANPGQQESLKPEDTIPTPLSADDSSES